MERYANTRLAVNQTGRQIKKIDLVRSIYYLKPAMGMMAIDRR